MEKKEVMEAPSASETVVDVDVDMDAIERRPLIMNRDEVDLEAGPGEQPQCRICLESDGTSHLYPFSELYSC